MLRAMPSGLAVTVTAVAIAAAAVATPAVAAMPAAQSVVRVLIVEGLGGEPIYARQFDTQVRELADVARVLDGRDAVHVLAGDAATRAAVLAQLRQIGGQLGRRDQLIVYLIGHGSFDGRQYKFNLPGPDLSDADLKAALQSVPAQHQLLIVTGSASGALLPILGTDQRVLVTATRNGDEKNVTRFGAALVAALQSPEADTDKDGRISAQEAFDFAQRSVQEGYRRDGLLASEHAVLQGGRAADFLLASLSPRGTDDGVATRAVPAEWLRRRAALNAGIASLERRKGTLAPADYQQQLQDLLLQLARLQQQIDQAGGPPPAAPQTAPGDAHAAP